MDGAIFLFWSGAFLTMISFTFLMLTYFKDKIK
jgi:hypothetical protein